jgi:hypothetical protein
MRWRAQRLFSARRSNKRECSFAAFYNPSRTPFSRFSHADMHHGMSAEEL